MSDYAFMKTGLVGEEVGAAIDVDRLIDLLRVMVDQTWEIATRVVRHHGWRRPTVEVPDVHAALKYQARYFLANMERGAKFEDEERSDDEIEWNEIDEAERSEDDEEQSDEAERSETETDEVERSEAETDEDPTCACDLCVSVHRATAEWPTWAPSDEIEAFLKTSVDRFQQQKSLRYS
jgi:cobalamin biosynthesis protein CobT